MANDNENLDIYIKADSKGVKTGVDEGKQAFESATDSMKQSAEKLASSTKSITQQIGDAFKSLASSLTGSHKAMASSAEDAAGKMHHGFKEGVEGVQGSFEKLSGVFEAVESHLGMIGGILAGGLAFKKAIDETNEWNEKAHDLSERLGVTTQEASVYGVAMNRIGLDSDMLVRATQRIAMQVTQGGTAFRAIGVDIRDASGNIKPAVDLIQETAEKIESIKNPVEQTQAGIAVFGKQWNDLREITRLTSDEMDHAREQVAKLGLAVSPEQYQNTYKYKEAMHDFGMAIEAIGINIGQLIMPSFARLATAGAELASTVVTMLKPAFDLVGVAIDLTEEVIQDLWQTLVDVGTEIRDVFYKSIADIFGEDIPGQMNVTASTVAVVKTLFIGLKVGIQEAVAVIGGVIEVLVDYFAMLSRVARKALMFDFSGAVQAAKEGTERIQKDIEKAVNKMVDVSVKGRQQMEEAWDFTPKPVKAPEQEASGGGKTLNLDLSKSKMASFETELAEKKVMYQEEERLDGSFKEFSKQQEVDYWRAKLSQVDKGSQDEKAIRAKIATDLLAIDKDRFAAEIGNLKTQEEEQGKNAQAKVAIQEQITEKIKTAFGAESKEYAAAQKEMVSIKKEASDQIRQVAEEGYKREETALLAHVDQEEAAFAAQQSKTAASVEDTLQMNIEFEDRRYAIKKSAIDRELSLVNPNTDPVLYQQKLSKIEELEAQHNSKIQQMTVQANAALKVDWNSSFSGIESAFSEMVNSMVSGTNTIRGAFTKMALSVGQTLMQMLTKWATAWAIDQAKTLTGFGVRSTAATTSAATQTTATTTSFTAQGAAGTAAGAAIATAFTTSAITSAAAFKAMALATIPAMAALAGASGIASFAAAPWPVDLGAPAFGAGVAAEAMAFEGMASAEGGYDIPKGVNPIVQTHEEEMILPSKQANVIRDLANQGGAGGDTHLHVHAVDAHSVKRLFENNGSILAAVVRKMKRNGSI